MNSAFKALGLMALISCANLYAVRSEFQARRLKERAAAKFNKIARDNGLLDGLGLGEGSDRNPVNLNEVSGPLAAEMQKLKQIYLQAFLLEKSSGHTLRSAYGAGDAGRLDSTAAEADSALDRLGAESIL
ncbi:MAG TPA: hypothetical protein VJJ83_00495 [Candidatus Babeliales bacterium]|nr:hypothetical protein [Candidatus Babeliales bacterium]